MDNYEIALEQQGGNDYSTPVGTHFTVRLEDKASFARAARLWECRYDRNGLGNRQKTIPLSASFPHDQAQKTEFEV
jgi:hypothetical protein